MHSSTIKCAAALAGILQLGAVAAADSLPQPPEVPLVEVEMRSADDGPGKRATGVVWPGGGVLVRLKLVEGAMGASVRGADGAEHASPGILTYQTEAGIALLAVDWGGGAPPAAEIAVEAPRPGEQLWLQFIEQGERAALRADVQSFEDLQFVVNLEQDAPAERIAGGPLVNEAGAIVGMPSGVVLGVAYKTSPGILPSVWPRAGVTSLRPDLLRAIKAGPVIAWTDWSETTVPKIREARKLVDDASKLYWKGQAKSDAIVPLLQRAVDLDPQNAAAWRMLTDFLYMNEQYEPALEAAKRAIALTITDGRAYTTASHALFERGNVGSAISAAEQAIRLGHEVGMNYWTIGRCRWKQGKYDEAIEAFKKCQALDPKDEKVKKSLAEAMRRLGRDEEARQYE